MIKEKVLKISVIVIALVMAISLYPILDMDEAWYASVSLRMAQTGNWLTPNFNGTPFPTKPPLWFWITGFTFKIFGPSEISARIWALLFTLFTAYLLRAWYRKSKAHIIYLSCLMPILLACVGRMDSAMVFFLTLAFLLGYRKRWFWAGVALGVSVLAKGPVSVAIWGITFLIYALIYDRRVIKGIVLSGLIAVLIGGSWFAILYLKGMKDMVKYFLFHENLARIRTGLEGHTGPFYYYLPILLLGAVPNLGRMFKGLSYWSRDKALFYIWFLVVLVIFSIAKTKLPHYILPLYPALALIMEQERESFWDWLSGGILILIPLAIIHFLGGKLPEELKKGLFLSSFSVGVLWAVSLYLKGARVLLSTALALTLALLVLSPFKSFYPHYLAGVFARERCPELYSTRKALAPSTVFYYGKDIKIGEKGKWILSYQEEIPGYKKIFEREGFSLYNGKWVTLRIFEKR